MAQKVEPQEAKESIDQIFDMLASNETEDHEMGRVGLLSRAMQWEAAPPTRQTFLVDLAELVAEYEAAKLREEEIPSGLKGLLLKAYATVRMTLLRQEAHWLASARERVDVASSKEFSEVIAQAAASMAAEVGEAFTPPA